MTSFSSFPSDFANPVYCLGIVWSWLHGSDWFLSIQAFAFRPEWRCKKSLCVQLYQDVCKVFHLVRFALLETLKDWVEVLLSRLPQAILCLMVLSLCFEFTITSTMASTLLDHEIKSNLSLLNLCVNSVGPSMCHRYSTQFLLSNTSGNKDIPLRERSHIARNIPRFPCCFDSSRKGLYGRLLCISAISAFCLDDSWLDALVF